MSKNGVECLAFLLVHRIQLIQITFDLALVNILMDHCVNTTTLFDTRNTVRYLRTTMRFTHRVAQVS